MNGLHVGNWDDALDAEHLRIEVTQLFISCIQDGSLTKIGKWKRSGLDGLRYNKLAKTEQTYSRALAGTTSFPSLALDNLLLIVSEHLSVHL
jgi:hypothetical protein